MKQIPLTQGKFALVDDIDYDYLNKWKWFYKIGYAARTLNLSSGGPIITQKTIFMHRIIACTPDGVKTDHKNGDGLDNQRKNLRNATTSQNGMNRKKQTTPLSSLYKGVSWDKNAKKWRSIIYHQKKKTHIGFFLSEVEAAEAYNAHAEKIHGNFSRLNIISLEPDHPIRHA